MLFGRENDKDDRFAVSSSLCDLVLNQWSSEAEWLCLGRLARRSYKSSSGLSGVASVSRSSTAGLRLGVTNDCLEAGNRSWSGRVEGPGSARILDDRRIGLRGLLGGLINEVEIGVTGGYRLSGLSDGATSDLHRAIDLWKSGLTRASESFGST